MSDSALIPGLDALDPEASSLVAAAADLIRRRYVPDWHSVAAAVRDNSGHVHAALNLDAFVGRAAVCAEAIALGMAISAGAHTVVAVAAVRHPRPNAPDQRLHVVSPCGICRELLADYAPHATVLVAGSSGAVAAASVRSLMPHIFDRPDKPRRREGD